MAKRPYEKEAAELRRSMHKAGFIISSVADISIELVLEKTKQQTVLAGVEVVADEDFLPGFFGRNSKLFSFCETFPTLAKSSIRYF